jgi:hypothetical protein
MRTAGLLELPERLLHQRHHLRRRGRGQLAQERRHRRRLRDLAGELAAGILHVATAAGHVRRLVGDARLLERH